MSLIVDMLQKQGYYEPYFCQAGSTLCISNDYNMEFFANVSNCVIHSICNKDLESPAHHNINYVNLLVTCEK